MRVVIVALCIIFTLHELQATLKESLLQFQCQLHATNQVLNSSYKVPSYCTGQTEQEQIPQELIDFIRCLSQEERNKLKDIRSFQQELLKPELTELKKIMDDLGVQPKDLINLVKQVKEPPQPSNIPTPETAGQELPPKPEELQPEAGEVPSAPPPPPPPAPPAPPIEKVKKKAEAEKEAEVIEGPAPLSDEDFKVLSRDQKRKSDILLISAILALGEREFATFAEAIKTTRDQLRDVRKNDDFAHRVMLDHALTHKEGLLQLFRNMNAGGPGQLKKSMDKLYEDIQTKSDDSIIIKVIQQYKLCIFDQSLFDEHVYNAIETYCISLLVSQRKVDAKDKVPAELKEPSDEVIKQLLMKFQQDLGDNKIQGLSSLAELCNHARLQSAFVLFTDMLWAGAEGSKIRNEQAQKVSPLLLLLRHPKLFKITNPALGVKILKIEIEKHVFDISIVEDIWQSDLIIRALESQLKQEKETQRVDETQFVSMRLKKVATIQQLQEFVKQFKTIYNKTGLEKLEQELKKKEPNVDLILRELNSLYPGKIPEEQIKQTLVAVIQDEKLMKLLNKARFSTLNFGKNFYTLAEQEFGADPSKRSPSINELINTLVSLFRTPKDVWQKLQAAFNNKAMLSKEGISIDTIYAKVDPYGILLLVLQYVIQEMERGASAQETWDMLMNSLRYVNGKRDKQAESLLVETGKRADSLEQQKKPIQGLLFAPALMDRDLQGHKAKPGQYSDQIKAAFPTKKESGLYDGKLTDIIQKLESKKIADAIDAIKTFVEKAQVIQLYKKEEFDLFLQQLKIALERMISK